MNFLHSCFKWILHVFDNESLNKIQFFLILERHWRHLVKTTVIQLNLQCALLVIRVLDYLCVIISMMPFQYQAKTGFHMCTIQYFVSLPCRLQVIEVVWLPSCFNIAVIINETFVNNMFCISSLDCCIWHSFCSFFYSRVYSDRIKLSSDVIYCRRKKREIKLTLSPFLILIFSW